MNDERVLNEQLVDVFLGEARYISETLTEHHPRRGSFEISEQAFYEELETAYEQAKELGVEDEQFREKALEIERGFIKSRRNFLAGKAKEYGGKENIQKFEFYGVKALRQQRFLQTQKSTGKTAVELGEEELNKRMGINEDHVVVDYACINRMLKALNKK